MFRIVWRRVGRWVLRPQHTAALITALGDQFYIPEEPVLRRAIERRGSFNLIHLSTMFKIFLRGYRRNSIANL